MSNLSVTDAQACVLKHVKRRDTEVVRLQEALGRVLAEEIRANRDQPPCDVSAMDGFAVCSSDLADAATKPATLRVIEDIKAGDQPRQTVKPGQCARIMTGAPVPAGADAVIRVEDTRAVTDDQIEFRLPVGAGNDIRRRGEGMQNGQIVLPPGTEITPGVVGVLATVKAARLAVYQRPRVAILATGDELEELDEPFDPDKIPNSNSYALMAQVQALGIEPVLLGIARDDPVKLARKLEQGLAFDVLMVTGGSSVGVHDHVRPTLESLGVAMHFWRVEMRPGHPVTFGSTDKTLVFGLPGNPVSSMVCFEQFVLPAMRSMMGHPRLYRRTISARLAHEIKVRPGRTDFIRVVLEGDAATGYVAHSTGTQSSGVLLSMAQANGLLVLPAASAGLPAGASATVQLLDGSLYQPESDLEETP